jgi:HAE1 family hydrophobic/amphiphilic exporter-1
MPSRSCSCSCAWPLYESWTVPLSVMLAVPLGVVGALLATYTRA